MAKVYPRYNYKSHLWLDNTQPNQKRSINEDNRSPETASWHLTRDQQDHLVTILKTDRFNSDIESILRCYIYDLHVESAPTPAEEREAIKEQLDAVTKLLGILEQQSDSTAQMILEKLWLIHPDATNFPKTILDMLPTLVSALGQVADELTDVPFGGRKKLAQNKLAESLKQLLEPHGFVVSTYEGTPFAIVLSYLLSEFAPGGKERNSVKNILQTITQPVRNIGGQ